MPPNLQTVLKPSPRPTQRQSHWRELGSWFEEGLKIVGRTPGKLFNLQSSSRPPILFSLGKIISMAGAQPTPKPSPYVYPFSYSPGPLKGPAPIWIYIYIEGVDRESALQCCWKQFVCGWWLRSGLLAPPAKTRICLSLKSSVSQIFQA